MSRSPSQIQPSSTPMDDWAIDQVLSTPPIAVIESLQRLGGDVVILGVGGKMGATTALMVRRGLDLAGLPNKRVYGVSRFSQTSLRDRLENARISTVSCDLTDATAVSKLPEAENVLFLAGQKFGTDRSPGESWIQNVIMPSHVAQRYRQSRIVAFSTGCVYPFAQVSGTGSQESDPVGREGEYASTCVGRERIFAHFSRKFGTPLLLFRLNYAVEFRYGVLTDIATKVWGGTPVDINTGWLNCIWQGDACARAIQCLERTANPLEILNVTGIDKLSVRELAIAFGITLDCEPIFTGQEAPTAWLADARKSYAWFGPPLMRLDDILPLIAEHVRLGGTTLGKPTHFESRTGKF